MARDHSHDHDEDHDHDHHHTHHGHHHDGHDHQGHAAGEPHQPQHLGASLLRMSVASRLGAAALAIAVLWAGVLLAMR
jgi:hypothetical protein